MEAIMAAFADQQAELSGLLDGLEEPDWLRPSACAGWTVADVVLHLCQTNELAIASVVGRFPEAVQEQADGFGSARDVDEGAELMVAAHRGRPGSELRDRWLAGVEELSKRLLAADPHERVVWVAGELSVQTLATTRLAETWIHTGDVAAAFDQVQAPTDRLRPIARLAWRTLPYAFTRSGRELHGPVAFELRGPDGRAWDFIPDTAPLTTVRGDAAELCLVAARRVEPSETGLQAEGPDADAVLDLVRTYA